MSDPSNDLQIAIGAALIADAGLVAALGGQRVFDKTPDPLVYPFVRIGEQLVNDDSTTCALAWEVFETIHIFSRKHRNEANDIAGAIRAALVDNPLTLAGYVVTEAQFDNYRSFYERDGVTAHGVLVLRYQIDVAP